jgi:hypothetical protein
MKKRRATESYVTLRFTPEEKVRIDEACRVCGGKEGRSAIGARFMLLESVSSILKADRKSRTPGARLRQRLHELRSSTTA